MEPGDRLLETARAFGDPQVVGGDLCLLVIDIGPQKSD